MRWPTLTSKQADVYEDRLKKVITELQEIAESVTIYPGGGGPAHCAREAAKQAEKGLKSLGQIRPSAQ